MQPDDLNPDTVFCPHPYFFQKSHFVVAGFQVPPAQAAENLPPGIKPRPLRLSEAPVIYAPRREFKAGEVPDQVSGWLSVWPNGEKINAPGERVEVTIQDPAGKPQVLFCDQFGAFNEVRAEIGSEIKVTFHYPGAKPGDEVWVTMEDGGIINGGALELKQTLDAKLNTTVQIGLAASAGKYHVKVRYQRDVKTLRFWAGPVPE